MAFVPILGFILGGIRFIIYKQIIKERNKILEKIKEDYKKFLKHPKITSDEEKRNFIKNLAGLYKFEIELKRVDISFKNLFFGFIGLLVGIFIFDVFGVPSLIVVIIILEVFGILSFLEFMFLNETYNHINLYESGKPPKEFIKKIW
ncbi:MAG: hypothetical protein QXR09_01785 [Candidatus Aenigmatarchaeota archaeon]